MASAALIGHLPCRFGPFTLLRCRGFALHLLLRILRRRRDVSSCTVHRAGWRVLIDIRTRTRPLSGATHCGSGTCVFRIGCAAAGVARAVPARYKPARMNDFLFICFFLVFLLAFAPTCQKDEKRTCAPQVPPL